MPHPAARPSITPNLAQILFSFRGRTGRWQFWQFIVMEVVVIVAATTAAKLFDLPADGVELGTALALLYPQLAVLTKRWHDRDRSAWWLALVLIPVVGHAWTLVECGFLGGSPGANRFGARCPD